MIDYDLIPSGYYWSLCAVMLAVLAYQFRIQFPIRKRRAAKMQDKPDDPGPKDYMALKSGTYRAKNLIEIGCRSEYPTRRFTADLIGEGSVLFIVQDYNYHRQGWPLCFCGEFNVTVGHIVDSALAAIRYVDTTSINWGPVEPLTDELTGYGADDDIFE